jgi:hypothetical protein
MPTPPKNPEDEARRERMRELGRRGGIASGKARGTQERHEAASVREALRQGYIEAIDKVKSKLIDEALDEESAASARTVLDSLKWAHESEREPESVDTAAMSGAPWPIMQALKLAYEVDPELWGLPPDAAPYFLNYWPSDR